MSDRTDILGVHIGSAKIRYSHINKDNVGSLHKVMCRFHIIDKDTRRHMEKSDPDRDVITRGETTNTMRGAQVLYSGPLRYIQPTVTGLKEWSASIFSSDVLAFNETLLVNDSLSHLIRPSTLLLFEIMEVRPSVSPSVYPIAWAYLEWDDTEDPLSHVGERIALQLHRPPGVMNVGSPSPSLPVNVFMKMRDMMIAPMVPPIPPVVSEHAPDLIAKQPERVEPFVVRMVADAGSPHSYPRATVMPGCTLDVRLMRAPAPTERQLRGERPTGPMDIELPATGTAIARVGVEEHDEEEMPEIKPQTAHDRRTALIADAIDTVRRSTPADIDQPPVLEDVSVARGECTFTPCSATHAGTFSPDGTFFACAAETPDGWVTRVHVVTIEGGSATLTPVAEVGIHLGRVHGVAFSPSGDYLSTVGADGRLMVWSVAAISSPSFASVTAGPLDTHQTSGAMRVAADLFEDFRYCCAFVPGPDSAPIILHGGSDGVLRTSRVLLRKHAATVVETLDIGSPIYTVKVIAVSGRRHCHLAYVGTHSAGIALVTIEVDQDTGAVEMDVLRRMTSAGLTTHPVLSIDVCPGHSVAWTESGMQFGESAVAVRARDDSVRVIQVRSGSPVAQFSPVDGVAVLEAGGVASHVAVSRGTLLVGTIRGRVHGFDLSGGRAAPMVTAEVTRRKPVSFVAAHPTLPVAAVGYHRDRTIAAPMVTPVQDAAWTEWGGGVSLSQTNGLTIVQLGPIHTAAVAEPTRAVEAAVSILKSSRRHGRRRRTRDKVEIADLQGETQEPQADLAATLQPLDASITMSHAQAPLAATTPNPMGQTLRPLGQTPGRAGGLYLPGLTTPGARLAPSE